MLKLSDRDKVLERTGLPGLGRILRKSKRAERKKQVRVKAPNTQSKTYLKALPLRDLADLNEIKREVGYGNILIIRITPLAKKSDDDVIRAVNELCQFAESIGGDIARLGEERVVISPPNVKIWREKTSIHNQPLPTAT